MNAKEQPVHLPMIPVSPASFIPPEMLIPGWPMAAVWLCGFLSLVCPTWFCSSKSQGKVCHDWCLILLPLLSKPTESNQYSASFITELLSHWQLNLGRRTLTLLLFLSSISLTLTAISMWTHSHKWPVCSLPSPACGDLETIAPAWHFFPQLNCPLARLCLSCFCWLFVFPTSWNVLPPHPPSPHPVYFVYFSV